MRKCRLLVRLIVVAIAALITARCKPTPTFEIGIYGDLENLNPSGQVVTYWYHYSGAEEEALLAMVDDFNATNEWGITVRGEYAGDYDEIYNRLIDSIPLGRVPDLSIALQSQAAAYTSLGGLVELTPYLESRRWGFDEEEWQDFFPFVKSGDDLPQFEGRYGFPPSRSMELLFYNQDWLYELGYSHPPRTWEEFREMACAASDPETETYGYEFSADPSTFADWIFNWGGEMFDEESASYAFGEQAGLDGMEFLQDLLDEECIILETVQQGAQADFGAGKVLFTIDSTFWLPDYRSSVVRGAGFNWSVAPLPTALSVPTVNIYGPSLSIFRTTPARQLAAWLFIRWFTEPTQQARWAQASFYFPVRASVAELLEDLFTANPSYAAAFEFLGYDIGIEPGVVGYQECRGQIGKMLTAIVNGADPASRLARTVEACNASLEEGVPSTE